MNTFRLYLWREWREHRFALAALAVVLPLATGLLSWPLPKGQVGDPLFQASVAAGFALVMLVVVGGELLGSERRGKTHGWLERLPRGLDAAFRAKLAFFAGTLLLAVVVGFLTARALARWHGGIARGGHQELVWIGAVATGVWTFGCSTWTQRGGLAVLAAVLVLSGIGFPVWRVLQAGYSPWPWELWGYLGLLVPSAFVGACLGYVLGTRRGGGVLRAALLTLGPAIALLAVTLGWSEWRMNQRSHLDPRADHFESHGVRITRDGRFALAIGGNRLPRWNQTPQHAVRFDLSSGTFDELGVYQSEWQLPREGELGMPRRDKVLLGFEDRHPVCFDLDDGSLQDWDQRSGEFTWYPRGLGASIWTGNPIHEVLRDPFRGRDYSRKTITDGQGQRKIWIRPGRWLLQTSHGVWEWFEPDTGEREAWPIGRRPLVILQDGGVLVASESGLTLEHPEFGSELQIESHGLEALKLVEHQNGARIWGQEEPFTDRGCVVLYVRPRSLLVIDPESGSSHRVECLDEIVPVARAGDAALIVRRFGGLELRRLDLTDGTMTPLGSGQREE